MSKRRLEGDLDDAVNMDVMMDNMTDVVGTLLMVLIIVQLKVNKTIDHIQANLPVVTQEQVAEVTQQAALLNKDVDEALAELKKREPDKAKLASEDERLREHEATLDKNTVQLMELEKLQQQLAQKKKDLDAAKQEMAKHRRARKAPRAAG